MTDRGPRARKNAHKGEQSHRAEARRFLTTPMARSMIRGLDDEDRATAWLGEANRLKQEGEIGQTLVDEIADKVREAQDK